MAEKTEFLQAIDDAILDADSLEQFINGSDSETVLTRLSAEYPTIKKALKELFENGGLPATPYEYLSDLLLVTAEEGDYAVVTNDPSESGYYRYTEGNWELQVLNNEKGLRTFLTGFLSKLGAVLAFTESDFTEMITALPPVTIDGESIEGGVGLKAIPVKGYKYLYHRGRLSGRSVNPIMYVIYGLNSLGEVKPIITYDINDPLNVGIDKDRAYHGFYPIPDDVIEIYVRIRPTDSDKYQADYSPILALGDSEASLRDWAGKHFSRPSSSDFPDLNTHGYTGNTMYDSTRRLWFVKGNIIHTHVNVLITQGRLHNSSTGKNVSIPEDVKNIRCNYDGFAVISTFNETHDLWDPSFVASYKITYNEVLSSSTSSQNYIAGSYLPTPTLKAVREVTFLDGTDQTAIQYLWYDADWNFYISSSLRGDKKLIMRWSEETFNGVHPHNYSMNFDKYGNIVCVYRIEHWTHTNNDDSIRKNPIIFIKDEGYKPVTVDFGSDKKPSGWMQNCGFLCTDEAIYITEYTRPSVATANTWKATYPLTDVNNWQVVQTFTLSSSTNPSTGVKHMHNVNRDPFTGFIYITSGDLDPAIYVSYDEGSTFSTIASGSEKHHRILNFIFTKDWIYWASDVASPRPNFLFKAARKEDGTLDTDNIIEIAALPSDSRAVYAAIYMKKIEAIVLLQREDLTATSIPIDIWDMKNNTMSRLDVIPSVAGLSKPLGFRCETFEYYPRGNEIPCGFSKTLGSGGYENHLGILGNTANTHAKVGNVVLTIERVGEDFTITYDTIV